MKSEGSGGHRLERLEQLMLEELRALFEDELSDPRLADVRPMAVVLSPDYRHARVHCIAPSGGPGRPQLEQAFLRASSFLRRRLAEAIEFKRVPDLRFIVDAERTE